MAATLMYYHQILKITEDYLGPAANRFVDRQISSHIGKSPLELTKNDIEVLALRIRSGLVVLTKDEKIVDEASRRLTSVGQNGIRQD